MTRNWAQDVDPAWSPDGSTIAFASDRTGNYEIYTMRADGSGVRRLTHDPATDRQPAWSPDGSRLVFSSDRLSSAKERKAKRDGYPVTHLYEIWADGSHLRRLTRGATADDQTPAWSPDGRTIMFAASGDPPRLVTISPDGTGRRSTGQTGAYPDWSPDGSLVVFLRIYYPDGFKLSPASPPPQEELALMRPDGSDEIALGLPAGPARWSPDGSRLVTASGKIFERDGTEVLSIPAGVASWQPLCTRTGDGHANVLRGSSGPDVICGLGGDDRITGGPGSDRLFGGAGNDVIDARDGRFDVVGCGPGYDTVLADRIDLVGVDCERVIR